MLLKPQYYQLETNYSQEEVFKILFENTIEKKFRLFTPNKIFEGKVFKDSFIIEKVTSGNKSYIPIIHGDFRISSNNSTIITFHLKQKSFVKIFIPIWFTII
ncbi:MAG: hypothetical protein KIG88_02450, partial [Weeksellaceae bacterium]|nr:hypothetical protein [Weeksellaceae bacterium]